ncbi:unnamed protein product [Miscanthus lutarioriparius]|uniref:Uncharacterized protein n=1 Tax=Miscanthus lutarioriparius TaxID=422564 RepID=A0A811PEX7_9POAL|nr:unnamed protein product [Miscanthus lutarioriparius]
MRNASGSSWCSRVAVLQQVLGPQASPHGSGFGFGFGFHQQRLGDASSSSPGGMQPAGAVMPPLLFRALASLNLLLLVGYLLLLLLAKLFARLHHRATAKDRTGSWYDGRCDHRTEAMATDEAEYAAADADVGEGQQADMLFWFDEAVFEDSTLLLGDEGKDHHHLYAATATARCLQVESNFPVEESARISPRNQKFRVDVEAEPTQHVQEEAKGIAVDVPTTTVLETEQRSAPAPAVVSPENVSIEGNKQEESNRTGEGARRDADADRAEHEKEGPPQGKKSFSDEGQHDVKLFVNNRALADTRKLLLEGGVVAGGGGGGGGGAKAAHLQDENDDKDKNGDSSRFGASTLTSESTSKSSVEWQQSSTVTKDSETEYPFSSSSRRSSARWESYTLFRKYDEDMVYFHRVGAQKLTETESFRSIKYQPRSMSERIVHKLTPKPSAPKPIGLRDPYPELERAYVAQVCLTWEALNWNYTSFRRHNGSDGNIAARCCPARVAQEFQQFQVLLHRFIENEPYECGRRPEVYARMKNSTPKLLLVPEFRDEDDEKDDLISAVQFLLILEESIRTFMTFLRADKRSHYEMFREMVKRRASAMDQTLVVITLKKANKKKKSRLKDLTRPRRCLKRTRLREEEELSILLGLIDLEVVARVLRMPEVTDQQLHWCEEKMNRVRIDLEGKMQRDPTPLFYPAH